MEQEELSIQIKQLQKHFFGERFVGASCSRINLSRRHSEKCFEWLKKSKGMLVLIGPPGCGKTYLCAALLAWLFGKVRDIYKYDERDFLAKVRASMDFGDYQIEIKNMCDHEFFIYDDLGSTGAGQTEFRQEALFSMINLRYESLLPTVITSNLNRQEIKERIGERGYSRLFAEENSIIEMWNYLDLRNPLSWREDAPKPSNL